jgi:hypothetical protein
VGGVGTSASVWMVTFSLIYGEVRARRCEFRYGGEIVVVADAASVAGRGTDVGGRGGVQLEPRQAQEKGKVRTKLRQWDESSGRAREHCLG